MNLTRKLGEESHGESMLGDFKALGQVLGSPDALAAMACAMPRGYSPAAGAGSLRAFLSEYRRKALIPLEIPHIQQAYGLASLRRFREILLLDRTPPCGAFTPDLEAASKKIGRRHLKAMLPLRDERIIHRYLAEVEAGRAHGWHTLVYGIFLAIYSLPLRQGICNYARQTQSGFILAAVKRGRISGQEAAALIGEFDESAPEFLQSLGGFTPRPRIITE